MGYISTNKCAGVAGFSCNIFQHNRNSNPKWKCLIVSSLHFVSDICVLLGYYAVQSGNSLSMFSENPSVHNQGSRIQEGAKKDFLSLKMGQVGYPETSVRNYHYMLCNMA